MIGKEMKMEIFMNENTLLDHIKDLLAEPKKIGQFNFIKCPAEGDKHHHTRA